MDKRIFLFDLDSTITKQEILPTISKEIGISEEMQALTEKTMLGKVPFLESFLQRVDLLKNVPVSTVDEMISRIEINELLAKFIREHKDQCYIVTGNLDVWIEKLIARLGMEGHVFCSKAIVENDRIKNIFSVLDKKLAVSQIILPFVAIGDGSNDVEMIRAAEIGIGYGGVRQIAPALIECASHVFYDEKKLVSFLEKLL